VLPDEGPRRRRVLRRARGIAVELTALVVVTLLLPVLLAVAAVVDLALWLRRRKPWVGVRLVAFAWAFLFTELRGLLGLMAIKVFSRAGSERRRRWVYDLRIHWCRSHLGAVRVLFGLTFEVEGLDQAGPGPALVLMRHTSIIDNAMADAFIGHAHGLGLRFILKRELEMIPTIDIGGRWVPTVFVRRASADTATETEKLRILARDLGPGEAILLYPEGTRATPAKIERAQAIVAERQPEVAPLAARLRHVLPPRLGGALALLDECDGADVVVFGHAGLDGFEYISDIWAGGLVGRTIRLRFFRHDAGEVPDGDDARVAWLYDRWQELDDWVGEQVARTGPRAVIRTG
jgi:1-acyl-sn-glycerol-3-phosphate acyltransferase